jgi:hypothetical protein
MEPSFCPLGHSHRTSDGAATGGLNIPTLLHATTVHGDTTSDSLIGGSTDLDWLIVASETTSVNDSQARETDHGVKGFLISRPVCLQAPRYVVLCSLERLVNRGALSGLPLGLILIPTPE